MLSSDDPNTMFLGKRIFSKRIPVPVLLESCRWCHLVIASTPLGIMVYDGPSPFRFCQNFCQMLLKSANLLICNCLSFHPRSIIITYNRGEPLLIICNWERTGNVYGYCLQWKFNNILSHFPFLLLCEPFLAALILKARHYSSTWWGRWSGPNRFRILSIVYCHQDAHQMLYES